MMMMEEALKALAGRTFKLFLRRNTGTTFKAITAGTIVTAILRSSSMVTLLVMSLAGAGIISLSSGIGMIMGANLGTTMTGWLVAMLGFKFDIEAMVLPLLAISGIGLVFLKGEKLVSTCKMLMGFSFMFLGLDYLKDSFAEIATTVDFSFLAGKPLLLFSLFGAVFTAIIQSSSLSMTIYLTSMASGILNLEQAAFLMVGSELGTTATGLLGTIKGNAIRRKVGYSQFWFNAFTCVVTLPLLLPYISHVPALIGQKDPLTALVTMQSLMNLTGILLFTPFLNRFLKWLESRVKDEHGNVSRYISTAMPAETVTGLESLEHEIPYFMQSVWMFNRNVFDKTDQPQELLRRYFVLKQHENEVIDYCFHLQQGQLSKEETKKTDRLLEAARRASISAKNLKDVQHNLEDLDNSIEEADTDLVHDIRQFQKQFYEKLQQYLIRVQDLSNGELDELDQWQDEFFHKEIGLLYKRDHEAGEELDKTSGLNMLRGINKSNESMIRALKLICGHEQSPA